MRSLHGLRVVPAALVEATLVSAALYVLPRNFKRRSRILVMTSRVKRAKYKAARGPYGTGARYICRKKEGAGGAVRLEYGNVQLQDATRVYLQCRKTVPRCIVIL